MSSDLLSVAKLSLLVLVTAAVGRRLVARVVPSSTPDERRMLAFPVGMALLAQATVALLFARLPARNGLAVLLVAGLLWARAEVREGVRGTVGWLAGFRGLPWSELLFRGLAVAVAAFGLVGCLAPETGWDTGVYHFTIARLWAEEGRMVVRPDLPFSYMPATMESLYAAGFLLHGEALASLINFGFYFAGLVMTRLWARTAGGERASRLAGFAYLSSATYILRTGGGDVEVGQAVYLGLAVYALLRVRAGASNAWLGVAGFGLGLLLGIKYVSAWFVAAFGGAWVVVRRRDGVSWRGLLAECGILAGVGLTVACPWYVRNFLVAGNPLAPLGARAPRIPWSEMLASLGTQTVQALWQDGFALACFVTAGTAAARPWRWVTAAIGAAALGILVNLALAPSLYSRMGGAPRYVTPAFVPLFVAGGILLDAILNRSWAVRLIAVAFLAAWDADALAIHAARNAAKVAVAVGRESRDGFLERRVNTFWATRRAERELSSGKKVLLVEERSYYCRVPFLHASDQQTFLSFEGIDTPRQFREFLDRHAIGIIVANDAAFSRTWGFRHLLARMGTSLPEAGVDLMESRSECSLYRVR